MVLRPLIKGVETGVYIVAGAPFLYIPWHRMLVMADLHLGFEEAASRGLTYSLRGGNRYAGIFLPRIQLRRVLGYLDEVSGSLSIERVVINGDLKHAFDRLLRQEREETTLLVKALLERGIKEVTVVRGNHDNFIKPVLRRLGVDFIDSLEISIGDKRILFTHGHESVETSGRDIIIIGHEHPSLRCMGVYRFPVFMRIPLDTGGILVVMPASGPYHPGVNVSLIKEEYLSPIIRDHAVLDKASVIAWIDLGSAEPGTLDLVESLMGTELLSIERSIIGNVEVAMIEFKDIETAHILCSIE